MFLRVALLVSKQRGRPAIVWRSRHGTLHIFEVLGSLVTAGRRHLEVDPAQFRERRDSCSTDCGRRFFEDEDEKEDEDDRELQGTLNTLLVVGSTAREPAERPLTSSSLWGG